MIEALYRKHRSALWQYCLFLTSNEDEANDLVQETFTRLIQRQSRVGFEDEVSRSYLKAIARNSYFDRFRTRINPNVMESLDEPGAADHILNTQETDDLHRHIDIDQILKGQIGKLNEIEKEVITLYYFHGLSQREISTSCSISVRAVKYRLKTGLRKIQAAFGIV